MDGNKRVLEVINELDRIYNNLRRISECLKEDPNDPAIDIFAKRINEHVTDLKRLGFMFDAAACRKHRQIFLASNEDVERIARMWCILDDDARIGIVSAMDDDQFEKFMKIADEEKLWEQ